MVVPTELEAVGTRIRVGAGRAKVIATAQSENLQDAMILKDDGFLLP